MDPVMKSWMFYNWVEDHIEENKVLDNQGYLIGSFINPDLVRKILGADAGQHSSSDEDFEKASNFIKETNSKIEEEKPKRRRRKKIKG